MNPDRMGRSKWQKVLPWYYTGKRKRSRQDALAEALLDEDLASGTATRMQRDSGERFALGDVQRELE